MTKSERQKVYDWLVRHKNEHGKVRHGMNVTQLDFERIRLNIRQRHPYATYEWSRIADNKIRLVVKIKELDNESNTEQ